MFRGTNLFGHPGEAAREAVRRGLEKAIQINHADAPAHAELSRLLLASGRARDALRHARAASDLAPRDADLMVELAYALDADRQPQAAWERLDQAIRAGCRTTRLALLCARIAPDVRRETQTLSLITEMIDSTPSPPVPELSSLHFAAARLLDSMGRYPEAFGHASRANSLRGIRYQPGRLEGPVNEFIQYFTRPTLKRLARPSRIDPTPVFIVGMARSGTSLVEQILASHPAVYGAGELDWVFQLWTSAFRKNPPDGRASLPHCLDHMSVSDLNALAGEYLDPLKALSPASMRITDKMPTNFLHLGLIAVLFPGARIIHCRRDPRDTCLSCYMTDFAAGHDFSCDLKSAAHFHGQYDKIMSHWETVLDLPILDVEYEKVVSDLEGQAKRMLRCLGLPWDERCLRFYENRRLVTTASSAQVRRPIYTNSVGRWRHYERFLNANMFMS
ncbi:MAG: uncharacterized protein JWN24_4985 [Phycisphaerales bacterium]|nr:uncharacterized protein [Phycisphaerales bacterium]